jgi:hypothetical protein
MRPEFAALVPRDKTDLGAAQAAVAHGWPAVEPVAAELLEWLQDVNWPVARVLAPFLRSAGPAIALYVRQVLAGEDEVWKYNVIQSVVAGSEELVCALQADLQRIARHPTVGEKAEAVDVVACEALESL